MKTLSESDNLRLLLRTAIHELRLHNLRLHNEEYQHTITEDFLAKCAAACKVDAPCERRRNPPATSSPSGRPARGRLLAGMRDWHRENPGQQYEGDPIAELLDVVLSRLQASPVGAGDQCQVTVVRGSNKWVVYEDDVLRYVGDSYVNPEVLRSLGFEVEVWDLNDDQWGDLPRKAGFAGPYFLPSLAALRRHMNGKAVQRRQEKIRGHKAALEKLERGEDV